MADKIVDFFSEARKNSHARIESFAGSPIESSLGKAWFDLCRLEYLSQVSVYGQGSYELIEPHIPSVSPVTWLHGNQYDWMFPQAKIGKYRADFVLISVRRTVLTDPATNELAERLFRLKPVVVECDGHDFHEKTKEQARRDKERDRFMTTAGFLVLRFTGSEIHADPVKCAREIESLFQSQVDAIK